MKYSTEIFDFVGLKCIHSQTFNRRYPDKLYEINKKHEFFSTLFISLKA